MRRDAFEEYPFLREHFHFDRFNRMQQECLPLLMTSNFNVVVSAPTATGKTVLFELALLKLQKEKPRFRAAYLAPIKSLCQQKMEEWKEAFKQLKICEMTGDALDEDTHDLRDSNLIVATPEKLDSITRRSQTKVELDLLLIDEVHMLSIEGRGACLEAVVTRIMTINNRVRVVAASATIPNIRDLARWLHVPQEAVKSFGEEYRPIRLERHVIGYPEHKSPFVFEKILNSKLPDIISKYSDQRPSLVFCQTQSGTIMACQMLINTLPRDYFVTTDRQLTTLVTKSKLLSTEELRQMMVTGVIYHNASLSYRDRKIIEELFIAGHVKVICTTSTLSMGVNLPARLVVIKATMCYRGAGKGYEEYTKAQIEQMVGRAGRPQFETEGVAVIMTTHSNVSRYQGDLKIEQLQSQLLPQLKEHINSEIALRTVQNLQDVIDHIKRTFLYVRMLASPATYGIKNRESVDVFLATRCTDTINDLHRYEMIRFSSQSKEIMPLEISMEVSKSYISVDTAKKVIDNAAQAVCLRDFLMMLCQATEIGKYRSKLDERKSLKTLNECIPFPLKQTIGTSQKKAFVLIQAHLHGLVIEDWQLRKQTRQICYFTKSLCYLVRRIFTSKKLFSGVYFCYWLINCLKVGAWELKEFEVVEQLPQLKKKADWIKSTVTNLKALEQTIASKELSTLCREPAKFCETVQATLKNYRSPEVNVSLQGEFIVVQFAELPKINSQFKSVVALIGDRNNTLQAKRDIRYNDVSTNKSSAGFRIKASLCPLYLAVLKEGVIGFDSLLQIEKNGRESVLTEINFSTKVEKPRRHTTLESKESKPNEDKRKNKSLNTRKQKMAKSITKISSQSSVDSIVEAKPSQDFHYTKKQSNRKPRSSSVKPPPKISRKRGLDDEPTSNSIINIPLPYEKPVKPIESYLQKVDQFESRFSTNPKRVQLMLDSKESRSFQELSKTDAQPTFRPNIMLTDYKKSAYDYFRNLMNFQ